MSSEGLHQIAKRGRISCWLGRIKDDVFVAIVQGREFRFRRAQTIFRLTHLRFSLRAIENSALVEIQATLEQIARFHDRPLQFALIGLSCGSESLPLLVICRDIFFEVCGIQKMLIEIRENLVFDLIQAKPSGVVTGPALTRRRASDPYRASFAVMDCHAATTASAFQKP
nr:hypothetical protein [Roseinatronobacter thiooxidans]